MSPRSAASATVRAHAGSKERGTGVSGGEPMAMLPLFGNIALVAGGHPGLARRRTELNGARRRASVSAAQALDQLDLARVIHRVAGDPENEIERLHFAVGGMR